MLDQAPSTARVLAWNLERKRPESPLGAEAIDHLFSMDPDVMTLTEVRTSFPDSGGHTLYCEPPRGNFAENERKVMIWSKNEWTEVDRFGAEGLDPTRFISGLTHTEAGPVRVLGVCVPWHMAEVTYPIDVKRKPWELHIRFLDILGTMLRSFDEPVVVAGDFNQTVPRVKYGNRAAAAGMEAAFQGFDVATRGQIQGCPRPGIDHIALSQNLQGVNVWGWPHNHNGNRLTDHDGAGVDVGRL